MKKLFELQNNFIDALYDSSNEEIFPSIKNGKSSKEELFSIYKNNLCANLINALEITYSRTYKILKKEEFKKLAREFISLCRSKSANLDNYGEEFADFLKSQKGEFYSDLATCEWLEQKSYLAKDADLLDIESLKELDDEKLFKIKFQLHPSCYLHSSFYNLSAKSPRNTRLKKEVYFLIFRENLEVRLEKISKNEFNFLTGVASGLSLYEIYEKYRIDIQECLQKYISKGVFYDFYF